MMKYNFLHDDPSLEAIPDNIFDALENVINPNLIEVDPVAEAQGYPACRVGFEYLFDGQHYVIADSLGRHLWSMYLRMRLTYECGIFDVSNFIESATHDLALCNFALGKPHLIDSIEEIRERMRVPSRRIFQATKEVVEEL